MSFKFTKYENNPILSPKPDSSWESLCVLNPAVIYDKGKFWMLYRAAGNDITHFVHLGLAVSDDGFNFRRCFDSPVLSPDYNGPDGGCVEDPRLIKIENTYYVTYASRPYAPGQYWGAKWKQFSDAPEETPVLFKLNKTATYLAMSEDLVHWKKMGRMTSARNDDRDVILFPEKINGEWCRISRPHDWFGEGYPCKTPSSWINFSDDMIEWDENKNEFLMTGEEWWEDQKMGGSCPPIKTEYGWLHIYHGVSSKDHNYRVGAVMLDLNDPRKIIARTKDFLMEPEFEYETCGYYDGCVFPTANVVVDGVFYLYYGTADKYCCVATCDYKEFLDYLMTECKI